MNARIEPIRGWRRFCTSSAMFLFRIAGFTGVVWNVRFGFRGQAQIKLGDAKGRTYIRNFRVNGQPVITDKDQVELFLKSTEKDK